VVSAKGDNCIKTVIELNSGSCFVRSDTSILLVQYRKRDACVTFVWIRGFLLTYFERLTLLYKK
jgi:hypothetical protein